MCWNGELVEDLWFGTEWETVRKDSFLVVFLCQVLNMQTVIDASDLRLLRDVS